MDQCQCGGKLWKNFQDHWSIRISPGKGMDQWLVHMNFPPNLYGPMALKVLWKFQSRPVLVHRVLFSENNCSKSTPWGTFRSAPWSTPVNGGRDRKIYGKIVCTGGDVFWPMKVSGRTWCWYANFLFRAQIFQKCCQTIFLVLWPSKNLSYKIVW